MLVDEGLPQANACGAPVMLAGCKATNKKSIHRGFT